MTTTLAALIDAADQRGADAMRAYKNALFDRARLMLAQYVTDHATAIDTHNVTTITTSVDDDDADQTTARFWGMFIAIEWDGGDTESVEWDYVPGAYDSLTGDNAFTPFTDDNGISVAKVRDYTTTILTTD